VAGSRPLSDDRRQDSAISGRSGDGDSSTAVTTNPLSQPDLK
jgi:hypothetical protein